MLLKGTAISLNLKVCFNYELATICAPTNILKLKITLFWYYFQYILKLNRSYKKVIIWRLNVHKNPHRYLSWTFCLMSTRFSAEMSRSRYSDKVSVAVSRSFWLACKQFILKFTIQPKLIQVTYWELGISSDHETLTNMSGT